MAQTPNTLPHLNNDQSQLVREIINDPNHHAWTDIRKLAKESSRRRKKNDPKQD